jgi:CDP-4-dehydro-6-deoxyglucose reductase, E1
MIRLVEDTIDNKDIDNLIDWLKTYPRLTKGPLTEELEAKFAKWLGTKYSLFCNSGSSANLLMLYSLIEASIIKRSAKVVVPSICWATDLSPLIQLSLQPIICDCNLDNLAVDVDHLEQIFIEESPGVLLLVSVLGISPEMNLISELCQKYNVILLEDNCESLGSMFRNRKLGTFGLMTSFSSYFGHHISTIEGGFIGTDDEELYHILKAIRSHGWDRDLPKKVQKELRNEWSISDFDSLYTFYYAGFNLRSTDLQARIGLDQIKKIPNIAKKRENNFRLYHEKIKNQYWKIKPPKNSYISNFAYPIIHENKKRIVSNLIANNIEVRPLICPSIGTQPMYTKQFGKVVLKNSEIVDKYGFYVPNHPQLTEKNIDFICEIINKGIKE